MDSTGEQLHPNWLALATVHIPLKRFIKEGTHDVQKGTSNITQEKYTIAGVKGDEIKEFYEELVRKEDTEITQDIMKQAQNKLSNKIEEHGIKSKHPIPKVSFEVRSYFRFAMENKLDELKEIDFKGENVNVCDNYGWSALMMASCEGAYETVEYLLSLGVDRNIKDKTGKTAKDLANKKGYYNIVELLDTFQKNDDKTEDYKQEEAEPPQPFFCEICKQNFSETSQTQHQTSTIHQFNMKSTLPANKLQKFNISVRNKGLQLMVKQGWNKESGLGPSQAGRLYPVKTVIRKQRTGLGIEQPAARVTHFEAYDRKAVQRHNSDYYKKKPRNSNDIRREKVREWKRDRRLRNELN
ncbi:G patch domain and ankyrin repeat-containing protein 1 homolog [Calliphora vicina]|uniref:G patch domain and ankyrin repeat-containing protein 1 homolog n=1 Tax=Calliphora vicina TaxID=7373 RepID=UPI00325BA0C0